MKTIEQLQKEFGARLVKLQSGAQGIRGGLRCEVKDTGEDATLDFVATDETMDRYNEVIQLAGWDVKNYLANPVVPDCHSYDSVARILGRTTSLTITDKMVNRVQFALDNPLGNMAYKMARGGFIKSESVGFIPLEWINGGKDEPERTYTKQELLEISLVVVPANPGATVGAALKSGAIEKSDLKSLADFLKQFCSTAGTHDDNPNIGPGANVVRLQLARDLDYVLRRAK